MTKYSLETKLKAVKDVLELGMSPGAVEKKADADKYSAEKRADSDKYKEIQGAMAIAEAIKLKGQANAEAKHAEGMAALGNLIPAAFLI